MDKLYELKEMLCEELEEYGSKDKLDVGGLEIVDKLAHAIKNIDKIIEAYGEEGYSGEYMYAGNNGGMGGGSSNRGSSRSYRGRSGRSYRSYARGQRRDSMGRYSREGGYSMDGEEIVEEIRGLMNSAPDEYTRKELEKLTRKLEQM